MSQKKVCRLCLGQISLGYSLLEEQNANMLECLTAIKVSKNDVISNVACPKCLSNLKFAFTIQQGMIQSNEKLKEKSLADVEIKQELHEEFNEIIEEAIVLKPDPDEIDNSFVDNVKLCSSSRCLICRSKIKEESLLRHIQEHFNQVQKCEFCKESFKNITEYQKHVEGQHELSENYHCEECSINFKYGPFYKIHIDAHKQLQKPHPDGNLPEDARARMLKLGIRSKTAVRMLLEPKFNADGDEGPFTCGTCNKQFLRRRQFQNHSHQKSKCPICGAEISKSNLRKHIVNHSSGPQICELCGATLRSLESLRGHLAHTHSNQDFTCEQCGKTFKKRYPYLLHKKKHAGEKEHVCENCGKAFLTFYNLNKHIKMAHLKLRPHICEYCKKAFSSRFALRTHVRQHTNETPYKCEFCGDGFRQNVSLRAHRKSKHNVIEPKTCACQVCGKEFGCEQAIISHMRLH